VGTPDTCHHSTQRRSALLLFLGVSLLYLSLSRGVFLYGDDVLMYQVTEGIIERGSVAVTSPLASEPVVAQAPPDVAFTAAAIPGQDGRGYAKYGIGQSLVAIPTYVLSDLLLSPLLSLRATDDPFGNQLTGTRIYGTALINAFIGAAVVAATFLLVIAAGYRQRTALLLAALLAGASLLPHYAAGFLSEPLSALCLTVCVLGLLRASQLGIDTRMAWFWLGLSGFAAGLALATRIATALSLIAPGLWLLWQVWHWWRYSRHSALLACLAWGVPITGWLAVIAAYNWTRFGSVTATGYGDEARAYTTPLLTGLYGLLLSPGRGIFWYVPPLFLALAGSYWFARRQPTLTLVIAGMLLPMLALCARYYVWHGGGVWGPRFLVPLLPLLMLPAAPLVERVWHSNRTALVVGLVALWGAFVTALAVLVPFDRYVAISMSSEERLEAALWRVSASPLVEHTRTVLAGDARPDIAAVRYASLPLALLALLAGTGGLLCIVVLVRQVWRSEASAR
jgi:4-amino-4-deoxy-L-arabinose transferase-like glycosyltransferase